MVFDWYSIRPIKVLLAFQWRPLCTLINFTSLNSGKQSQLWPKSSSKGNADLFPLTSKWHLVSNWFNCWWLVLGAVRPEADWYRATRDSSSPLSVSLSRPILVITRLYCHRQIDAEDIGDSSGLVIRNNTPTFDVITKRFKEHAQSVVWFENRFDPRFPADVLAERRPRHFSREKGHNYRVEILERKITGTAHVDGRQGQMRMAGGAAGLIVRRVAPQRRDCCRQIDAPC